MFTIIAFSESQDPATAFAKVAGVPDQHVKVQGDGIYIMEFNRLMGGMACLGTTAAECRLISPSLRRINPHYIAPVDLALYPDGYVHHVVSPRISIPLDINEALECEENSDPAAAERHTIVVWLADREIQPVAGRIFTVNVNITLALVAGAWAFSEIDFVDELPVGQYSIVGMRAVIATAVAIRLVPIAAHNRPGAPCVCNKEYDLDKVFRFGNLGVFCQFPTTQPPGVEVLSSAAAAPATYEVYLDLLAG